MQFYWCKGSYWHFPLQSNCFMRLKQLFHTLETTVSYAWNNCFIRLKQLFHTLETVGTLYFATGISWFKTDYTLLQTHRFPIAFYDLWQTTKISSINQHQWEAGFLFFSWMDSRLSRNRFCSSFRHAVRYATEWKTKPAAQRNEYIASWLYRTYLIFERNTLLLC